MANNILYRLSLDSTNFQSGLKNAEFALKKAEKMMGNVGEKMSTYVTAPLIALGGLSVMAWDASAKAIAQIEAGLISTGGAVGYTKDQLLDMAAALQNNTLFDDDEILQGATAQLLTFTNVVGEQFAKAQEAAMDLSTRLGGDLQSSAIMLGKALNDPIKGLAAMGRVGIQFSESQQQMIKSLASSGNLMEAQNLILAELERQYGGSAEAAVVGAGKITQLKNSIGDLMEEFGRIIMDGITPFIERVKEMITWFQGLSEETKKTIVVIAAIASAIGPVTLAIAGLITATKVIMTTLAALSGPVTLVVAGLAALAAGAIYVWQNWEAIKERISDWSWWRNMLIDMVQFLAQSAAKILDLMTYPWRKIAEALGLELPSMTKSIDPLIQKLEKLKTEPKEYANNFGSFGDAVKGAAKDAAQALGLFSSKAKSDLQAVTTSAQIAATAVASVGSGGGASSQSGAAPAMGKMGSIGVDSSVWKDVADTVASTKLPNADFETEKLKAFGQSYAELANQLQEPSARMMETFQAIGQTVDGVFSNLGYSIMDSLGLAEDGFQGFIKTIGNTVIQLISMFLAQSIAQAIAGATASGTATGPAAIFTTPAFIATAVGGILAAFAAIPKFAQGGLAYSPMLAMVGDNRNAKTDPEIIAPLSKLRGMMGFGESSMVQDRIEIDGEKLYVLFKRVEKNRYYRT